MQTEGLVVSYGLSNNGAKSCRDRPRVHRIWGMRVERRKSQRSALFAEEKLIVDWKKGLQPCGAGRKSQRSLANNQMGNIK
jgi:hypothetical protein